MYFVDNIIVLLISLAYPLVFVYFVFWFIPRMLSLKAIDFNEARIKRLEEKKRLNEKVNVLGESYDFRTEPTKSIKNLTDI